jgi:hypothetical protein
MNLGLIDSAREHRVTVPRIGSVAERTEETSDRSNDQQPKPRASVVAAVSLILLTGMAVLAQENERGTEGTSNALRQPGDPAWESLIATRRAEIEEAERRVAELRADLEIELDDVARAAERRVRNAQAGLQNATANLRLAEIALKEYEEATFVQDLAKAEGGLVLANSALDRAADRLESFSKRPGDDFGVELERVGAQIAVERARLQKDMADQKIKVLRDYTKHKEVAERRAVIERRRAELLEAQAVLQREEVKRDEIKANAKKHSIVNTDDYVLALIDESVTSQGKIVALTEEARNLDNAPAATAEELKTKLDRTSEIQSQIQALTEQNKKNLTDAVAAAKLLQGKRAELWHAESELIKAREHLETLESRRNP